MSIRSVTKELTAAVGAKFILVELGKEGPTAIYDDKGDLLKFNDGGEAAKAAVRYTERIGRKVQPRRVNDDKWREREATKLTNGEHVPLPWHNERWWQDLQHVWRDHYPHASLKNGAMLAFTETEEKGAADIQTRIKPGRYLERYFGKLLNQYVIRDLCTVFSAKFEDNLLMFTETEEETEEVYTTGPGSCMSHAVSAYATGGVHPSRVYSAPGDCRVAYMKRDGRVVARVVVDVVKKTYSSIYGDSGRLQPMLQKEGYKSSHPYGARILRHVCAMDRKTGLHQFVVPHIDGILWVKDEGDFLRVGGPGARTEDGIMAEGAKGVSEQVGHKCARCSDGKSLTSRQIKQVFVTGESTRSWCAACAKEHAFTCPASSYVVDKAHGVEVGPFNTGRPPRMIWNRYLKTSTFTCPVTGRPYLIADAKTLYDGTKVSMEGYTQQQGKICRCGLAVCNSNPCPDGGCKRMQAIDKATAPKVVPAKSSGYAPTSSTSYSTITSSTTTRNR